MKKIIALLLALVMIFSFSGCFSLPDDYVEKDNHNENADDDSGKKDDDNSNKKGSDAALESELIFSVNEEIDYIGDEALVYTENGKYGLITADGNKLSADYTSYIELEGDNFNVSTKPVPNYNDPASVNVTGVINKKGEMIVPEKYYGAEALNDRLFVVYTVDGIVTDEEQAVTYRAKSGYQFNFTTPSSEDTLYSGKWEIYDTKVNAVIPGLSGTKMDDLIAYGNIINVNWEKQYFVDGSEAGDNIETFSNGCYEEEGSDGKTAVYDEDSRKLFEYDSEELYISDSFGASPDFFRVSKNSQYYVMDKNGAIVSEAFSEYIDELYFDEYVSLEKNSCYQVLDLEGNEIIAPDYTDIEVDEFFGIEIFLMINGTEYAYFDNEGNKIASTPADAEYYHTDMVIEKKNETNANIKDCFNISTNSFDLKHSGVTYLAWCAEISKEDNGVKYGIVDILSGKEIVECKYNKISVFGDRIVAYDAVDADNSYDVYQIRAK